MSDLSKRIAAELFLSSIRLGTGKDEAEDGYEKEIKFVDKTPLLISGENNERTDKLLSKEEIDSTLVNTHFGLTTTLGLEKKEDRKESEMIELTLLHEKKREDLMDEGQKVNSEDTKIVNNQKRSIQGKGVRDKNTIFLKNLRQVTMKFEEESLSIRVTLRACYTQIPCLVFSLVPFSDKKAKELRKRRLWQDNLPDLLLANEMDMNVKRKAISYQHLLKPSWGPREESADSDNEEPNSGEDDVDRSYDPNFLDDPELRAGKHKTAMTLPCYVSSVLQYVRPEDLRRNLNDQFRESHPDLHSDVTLSKIRKIKQQLLDIGMKLDLEVSTVAKSYVYFEKLVLKHLITKANRRILAAVSLILAVKVNDPKVCIFSRILEEIENVLNISEEEIRKHEFTVFAALRFSLHLQEAEVLPHFNRIISSLEYSNIQEYLGERMYALHFGENLMQNLTPPSEMENSKDATGILDHHSVLPLNS